MSKLEKQLADWVGNNLISADQATQIATYEATHSRSWAQYGFLMLGAIAIGIGIISLIAANWDDISDGVKLGADFLLLALIAIGAYRAKPNTKPKTYETLLLLFMALCLASIGLISQVYHTGGELEEALLLWAVITTGVAAVSQLALPAFLWANGLFGAGTAVIMQSHFLKPYVEGNEALLVMFTPLLSYSLNFVWMRLAKRKSASGFERGLAIYTVWAGLAGLLYMEFMHSFSELSPTMPIVLWGIEAVIVLIALGSIWSSTYSRMQKGLVTAALSVFVLGFHLHVIGWQFDTLYAVCSVLVLAFSAIFLASIGRKRTFQLFLVLLGIRFLILYFQALGGLATTGIGLIVSGLLIIAMVSAWAKLQKSLRTWAERLGE